MSTSREKIRDMIWGGIWGALALLLPIIFHPLGLGKEFMPMFIPMLVAGFTLRFRVTLILSLLIPLLSSFLTGMPSLYPPIAPLMCLEFIAMTQIAYWTYQKMKWNIFSSLILGFLVDRVLLGLYILVLANIFHLPGEWLIWPALVKNIPGIILNFITVPVLVSQLKLKLAF